MSQDVTGGYAACERAAERLARLCFAHDKRYGKKRDFLKELSAVLAYACHQPRKRRPRTGTPLAREFYYAQLFPMVRQIAENRETEKIILGKLFLRITGAVVPPAPPAVPEVNDEALGSLFTRTASSHR